MKPNSTAFAQAALADLNRSDIKASFYNTVAYKALKIWGGKAESSFKCNEANASLVTVKYSTYTDVKESKRYDCFIEFSKENFGKYLYNRIFAEETVEEVCI